MLPACGGDIYSITDRATGVDVLFKTPWGWRDPALLPPSGTTQGDWLARYAGGWQVLLPNAGYERRGSGVVRGYHGEAAVVPWQAEKTSESSAVLTVDLLTAPLTVTRQVTLSGPVCRITETVLNNSAEPQRPEWVHHPAFGVPFAGPACRLEFGARTLITDASTPGTLLPPDAVMPATAVTDASGRPVDLSRLASPQEPREILGTLTDFETGWFALTNSDLGFGIGLAWSTDVFPHAWIWQECHATPGFPWFRRAYAIAVEPANVLLGDGPVAELRRGDPPVLPPHASVTAELTLTRFAAGPPISTIRPDGSVMRKQ